jgi:hypothetical protein
MTVACFLLGCLLVVVGIALVFFPAGLVAGGVLLVGGAVRYHETAPRDEVRG